MRYKFRCWDVENKRWSPQIDTMLELKEQAIWNPEREEHYPVTMWTGLKDKNGKEIYEGDVCKKHYDQSLFPNRTEDTGVVEWVGFGARFTLRMPHQNGHNYYCELYENLTQPQYIRSPFEVIGNIYENPSLLTTKQ